MSAGIYDFYIEQGATFTQTLIWTDGDGTPVNLTGYSARMQIRPSVTSETIILSLTSNNGRITLGGATGAITLTISAVDSAALDKFSGVYDLELEAANGFVTRLLEGGIAISREVTR